MNRATWRVLRSDFLRGAGLVLAVSTAAAGIAMLYLWLSPDAWYGRWGALAEYTRMTLNLIAPLAVAVAAWHGGRDGRNQTRELTCALPRPRWQYVALRWLSLTIAAYLGLLVTWLTGAVQVAPIATYSGGGWWWMLAVAFVFLGAATALGLAAGIVVPSRLTAPIAGGLAYAALWAMTFSTSGVAWLVPTFALPEGLHFPQGRVMALLAGELHLLQALWFGALAVTLMTVASARRRLLAVVPATVALTAAIALATGPGEDRWKPDPQARELMCTKSAPEVCMIRADSFLLDDLAGPAQRQLSRWEDVPGGFSRAVELPVGERPRSAAEGVVGFSLTDFLRNSSATWTGSMEARHFAELDERALHDEITAVIARSVGDLMWDACGGGAPQAVMNANMVGQLWIAADNSNLVAEQPTPSAVEAAVRLQSLSVTAQKVWMGRSLAAARACDAAASEELLAELT